MDSDSHVIQCLIAFPHVTGETHNSPLSLCEGLHYLGLLSLMQSMKSNDVLKEYFAEIMLPGDTLTSLFFVIKNTSATLSYRYELGTAQKRNKPKTFHGLLKKQRYSC